MTEPKPICIHGSQCYRRNFVHFKTIAHPHLEKLLDDCREDMPIELPTTLDFQCVNRSLLMEQLAILRRLKRKTSANKEEVMESIDLTDENESYANSQSRGKENYLNFTKSPRKNEEHEATQSRDEKYERTLRWIENCQNNQRFVENQENTHKVENNENMQCEVELIIENPLSQREEMIRKMRASGEAPVYVPKSGKFAGKLRLAAPYYIFFTTVQNVQLTWTQKLSVTMPEILDKSLGKITRSLHLTFLIDMHWLLCQYKLAEQTTDMLVFFSKRGENYNRSSLPTNVKMEQVTLTNMYSVHHSKVSILQYEDGGIRIIVTSADLDRPDWEIRTQGLWISPHLPLLPNSDASYLPTYGESRTGFKRDFLEYLSRYNNKMNQWCSIVQKCDFSAVNVAFVASVPGSFPIATKKELGTGTSQLWGHRRLAKILENHAENPDGEQRSGSMIIAQATSVGSLGPTYDSWVGSELVESMSQTNSLYDFHVDFHFIFPSIENYKESYDMINKSTCIYYKKPGHLQQRWITRHLCTWKASCSERTKALPNIKTFTRVSADGSKMWWFYLGSANLSKAAWGWRQGRGYRVNNYEAGVVFLPKFLTGAKSFPIKSEPGSTIPNFPLPYDLPLTHYGPSDTPYFTEYYELFHGAT